MARKYKKGMRKLSYLTRKEAMEARLDAADIPKYQKRKIERELRKKRRKRQQEQED